MHWEIHPSSQSNTLTTEELPAFQAGLLYGYSVYTTFKLPLDEIWLKAHLTRLESNATTLGLQWRFSQDQLLEIIQQHFKPETPVYRLTLIPEVEHYGDFYRQSSIPSRMMLSLRPAPPHLKPISLKTVHYSRPLPGIKLGGIGELIFLKRQAQTEGFDDILLVNAQGSISEASTANLFFICREQLYTPNPQESRCFPGITRLKLLDAAIRSNTPFQEASIKPEAIETIDGAFLTNAAQGFIPVGRIDTFELPWPDYAVKILGLLYAYFEH